MFEIVVQESDEAQVGPQVRVVADVAEDGGHVQPYASFGVAEAVAALCQAPTEFRFGNEGPLEVALRLKARHQLLN